jgi:hypothetical protein
VGYQLLLDVYTRKQLVEELLRRDLARAQGKCDYCGQPLNSGTRCMFPTRHAGKE